MRDSALKQSRILRVMAFGLMIGLMTVTALMFEPVISTLLTTLNLASPSMVINAHDVQLTETQAINPVLINPLLAGRAPSPLTHIPITALSGSANAAASGSAWETVTATNTPIAREEDGFVYFKGKFYLIGGHSINPISIYDPVSNTWTNGAAPLLEIHHIQAVVFNNLIYIVAAYTGTCCTAETGVSTIYIYNPATNVWSVGDSIPQARRRGSVGVVLYNNKFYLVGGLTGGHGTTATSFNYFDVYDPLAHTWATLPNAPRHRDHFEAAMVGTKLYAIGGRDTTSSDIFGNPIAPVDVYDFSTGAWSTLPASANLPTPRGGVGTVVVNNQIIVIGGESDQYLAHNEVESFNPSTNTWTMLPPLNQGRHGTQAALCNGTIYIASGAGTQGGSDLLTSMERYQTAGATVCAPPANDNFANPTPITTSSYSNQTNANATLEAQEQRGSCEGTFNIQNSVWYRYTALGTENVTFTVSGSTPVKSISVWTGSTLGSLTQMGCGSGVSASAVVTTIKGTVYNVRIGSSNGVGSSFTLAASALKSTPLRNNFTTGNPTLTWNRITNATQYIVQVSKTGSFNGTLAFTTSVAVNQLSVAIPPQSTLTEGIYYWRVSANGGTTWSTIDSFVVDLP